VQKILPLAIADGRQPKLMGTYGHQKPGISLYTQLINSTIWQKNHMSAHTFLINLNGCGKV
jgi:hypothetical protein